MADGESDLETDRLESELEALCCRYCTDESSLQSKEYCSGFCELVEEHTVQWQVPLPQLNVLRTALCCFTRATAAFPDGCQHVSYAISSLALSFFELMLFFSKEEFQEAPLKDIVDAFLECHCQLQRHRNKYLLQLKQVLKGGGPWENPVLQAILGQAELPHTQVEEYLPSEVPVFFELRVRYLQACERLPEAMALAKSCLEHPDLCRLLFFHQAYLTCLHKASLHERLYKEVAELDGRDGVEIVCNAESVERDDELLLSLCKAFLSQQLHSGDMYHIWDLVFLWSQLHLRLRPSTQGFLSECRQLVLSAANVRAVFPFIKVITAELGSEGVPLCVELCTRALQCDPPADPVARSLLCKTLAFLLPRDLEVCRACALLVFCQERSLEAYHTMCALYTHPEQEPHQQLLRTSVRFHVLQALKKGLHFDPEFWNLLTLRSHCAGLLSDQALKAAVLREMQKEREEELRLEGGELEEQPPIPNIQQDDILGPLAGPSVSCTESVAEVAEEELKEPPEQNGQEVSVTKRTWTRRRRRRKRGRRMKRQESDDPDSGDDPEIKYFIKTPDSAHSNTKYSLRCNPGAAHPDTPSSSSSSDPVKLPPHRQREYLSRRVKNQILKRRGRKRKWLQGLPGQELAGGVKRPRRAREGLELSFPENEVVLEQEEKRVPGKQRESCLELSHELQLVNKDSQVDEHKQENELTQTVMLEEVNGSKLNEPREDSGLENHVDSLGGTGLNGAPVAAGDTGLDRTPEGGLPAQGDPELDGPALELQECPLEFFHNYSEKPNGLNLEEPSGAVIQEQEEEEAAMETSQEDVPAWKAKLLRARRYAHLQHHCSACQKDFRGLNVVRHCLAHLKRAKRCIICSRRFHQLPLAKKHVLQHIEEMLRYSKPPSGQAGETPAVNGSAEPAESDPSNENEAPPANATAAPKPKSRLARSKQLVLPRESRIIHNVRTLIRKSRNLQRRGETAHPEPRDAEFTDEQVTIRDHMVFVMARPAGGDGAEGGDGGGEREPRAGENGALPEQRFYLCPSAECDRVFSCQGVSLSKHAVNSHLAEETVQEKTFTWGKGKCPICCRMIQLLQHYKDHMKRHDDPLRFFCYHAECSDRFKTHQELKDHIQSHDPFRPRCSYPSCEQLFSGFQALYDHEWRHYTQARPEELEPGPKRRRGGGGQQPGSAEASWKQRVKIEEEWLHGGKGQRERTYVLDHSVGGPVAGTLVGEGLARNGSDCVPGVPVVDGAAVSPGPSLTNGEHRDHNHLQTGSGGAGPTPAQDFLTRPRTATAQYFTPHRLSAPLRPKTYPTPSSLPASTATQSTLPQSTATQSTLPQSTATQSTLPQSTATQSTLPQSTATQSTLPQSTATPGQPLPSLNQVMAAPTQPSPTPLLLSPDPPVHPSPSPVLTTASSPTSPGPGQRAVPQAPFTEEPLDIRDSEEHATLSEPPKLALVPEPAAPKPRDPPFVKGPYKRLSASTYLDESALSMRKRSSHAAGSVVSPAKPWAFIKASSKVLPAAEPKVRHRCPKCLTLFGAVGELEEHRALDRCNSLFGFDDSDDDS